MEYTALWLIFRRHYISLNGSMGFVAAILTTAGIAFITASKKCRED